MKKFNARDYWEGRLSKNFSLGGVGQHSGGLQFNIWAYRARRRAFLRTVRSSGRALDTVQALDIGSGTGFYIDRWQELGVASVAGIDLTDVAVSGLKDKYPACSFYRADIGGDIPALGDGQFDFVSCMDVLFHVVDDERYRRAIENVYALVKPGGFFVFSEAFDKGLPGKADYIVHRGLEHIEDILRDVGFRTVARRPFLVLLNDPVGPDRWFMRVYWKLLRKIVRRFRVGGAVVGTVLYPIELTLAFLLKKSPSTGIVLCQRPLSDSQ